MKHNVEHVEHFYGKGHGYQHEQKKVKAAFGTPGHKMNHEYTKEIGHPASEDHGDVMWPTDGK
jgi:hypothetical protein